MAGFRGVHWIAQLSDTKPSSELPIAMGKPYYSKVSMNEWPPSAPFHSLNWDFMLNRDFLKWNFVLVTRFRSLNRDFTLNWDSLNRNFTVLTNAHCTVWSHCVIAPMYSKHITHCKITPTRLRSEFGSFPLQSEIALLCFLFHCSQPFHCSTALR